MKRRESEIQRAILDYLKLVLEPRGGRAWRSNNIPVYDAKRGIYRRAVAPPGLPDIQGYMPDGRALYIEVKRPGGRLSEAQRNFLARTLKAGCVAFVAWSLDDVMKVIGTIRGKT